MGASLQPQSLQSLQPLQPLQQGVVSHGAGAKASLPSTWADHSVNINLDFLGPGGQPPKPSQPSLNKLQQGELMLLMIIRYRTDQLSPCSVGSTDDSVLRENIPWSKGTRHMT